MIVKRGTSLGPPHHRNITTINNYFAAVGSEVARLNSDLEQQLQQSGSLKRHITLKFTLFRLSRYLQVCPAERGIALHRLP